MIFIFYWYVYIRNLMAYVFKMTKIKQFTPYRTNIGKVWKAAMAEIRLLCYYCQAIILCPTTNFLSELKATVKHFQYTVYTTFSLERNHGSKTVNTYNNVSTFPQASSTKVLQSIFKCNLFYRILHFFFHLKCDFLFQQLFSVSAALAAVANTSLTPSLVLAEHSK